MAVSSEPSVAGRTRDLPAAADARSATSSDAASSRAHVGSRPARGSSSRAAGSVATEPDKSGWLVPVLILVIGQFMSVLDVTIVNVAVPSIQKDFGGSQEDVLWIATAYTLTLGVVVPVSGWLGDRVGLTKVYTWALVGFAIGSAACGLAWDLDVLIGCRVFQAIPGGLLPVVSMSLLPHVVPKEKMGSAMGIFGLGIIFAPAVGPVLGGYLVQYLDWRLVFYINVPVGILGAVISAFGLQEVGKTVAQKFDFIGFALISVGLSSILLAAEKGTDWGWTGYRILILWTLGALSLAFFIVVELETKNPLLDLRAFKTRTFTQSIILLVIMQVNLFATLFFVPVFLQQGQHKQAFDAGILIFPQAVVTAILMPIAGRLYDRIGPRWLSVFGMAICAWGTHLLYSLDPTTTREAIITWTCIRAIGVGLAMMPMLTAGLAAVPDAMSNQASAINNVTRQVGGALGLAGLSAMASLQQQQIFADWSGLFSSTDEPGPPDSDTAKGFATLYRQYQTLVFDILGTSYGNIFLVVSAATAACVMLAFYLPSGKPPTGQERRLD